MKSKSRLYTQQKVRGETRYVVRVVTTSGKRERRFFKSAAEAQTYGELQEVARLNQGVSAFSLTEVQRVEAAEAIKRLGPSVSLREVTDFYISHFKPAVGPLLVCDLIEEHLASKKALGCDEGYVYSQRVALGVFARDFGIRDVRDVTQDEIEAWFAAQKWKPLNHRNYLRDVGMLMQFAVRRNYIAKSPVSEIHRPRVALNPLIFTVEETKRLLAACQASPELNLTPIVVVALFAGIRICEMERMDWSAVDLEERCIRLSALVTKGGRKGRRPRNVEIHDVLAAWLGPIVKMSGPFWPRGYRTRNDKLFAFAGLAKKKNALRHCYASYFLKKSDSVTKTIDQLGQKSASVLYDHYKQQVRLRDANEYFALTPDVVASLNS